MKKFSILTALMMILLSFSLVGCGSQQEPVEEADGPVDGGWTINADAQMCGVPDEAIDALNKATEEYTGMTLEPVALLGTQVVAGTNYSMLCKGATVTEDPETKWVVAVVYAGVDGTCEILNVADFDLDVYAALNEDASLEGEAEIPEAGGWEVYPNETPGNLGDAQEAWDAAMAEFVGTSYNPEAVLGTQVVAGTNYAILTNGTTVTAEPVNTVAVLTIYQDTEGASSVINIKNINLADFNQ